MIRIEDWLRLNSVGILVPNRQRGDVIKLERLEVHTERAGVTYVQDEIARLSTTGWTS